MPAGLISSDSMFSVRETPWHGLGAVLERPPATIAEAIEASGLTWRVAREPIAIDRGDAATVGAQGFISNCTSAIDQYADHFGDLEQEPLLVNLPVGARWGLAREAPGHCSAPDDGIH